MPAEAATLRRPRAPAPTTAERLRTALDDLSAGHGAIVSHAEKPWASITFEGARHTVELAFEGDDAVAAGERLVVALPEHEFTLRGWLVAEARVAAVDHRLLPQPRLGVTCELLLLKDA